MDCRWASRFGRPSHGEENVPPDPFSEATRETPARPWPPGVFAGAVVAAPARFMASVVIPAHNEARVIERGLSSLLEGARPGELEIVVVCNGCTDDTAARAR